VAGADDPARGGPRARAVRADPADVDTLSQVVADAFHNLAPSRWLIADPAIRRRVFPGYFRLYVEHAMTHGVVQTTGDRTAAALWIPVGAGGPGPPAGYDARLRAATGRWIDRFVAFDAALDEHHPTGISHHHLALLAVRPDQQGRGTGTALLRSTTRCSTTARARPLTWRPATCVRAGSTCATVTPTTARRSSCPAAPACTRCGGKVSRRSVIARGKP